MNISKKTLYLVSSVQKKLFFKLTQRLGIWQLEALFNGS